jgi:predicted nucleotidyltransferase
MKRIVDRIVALYDPDAIYLFGSYAKGNMTERSDLDFIVVKPTDLPPPMRGRDVVAILAEVPVDIDLIFLTPEELEVECCKELSLIGTVLPSAFTLYARVAAADSRSDSLDILERAVMGSGNNSNG